MATKKRWTDFSGGQRAAILVASAIEVVLTSVALADLARRPRVQVRGPSLYGFWVAFFSLSSLSHTLRLVVARPDL
jgi:hypothetical protein